MDHQLDRRQFLQSTAAATLASTALAGIAWTAASAARAADAPSGKVRLGLMGLNGRGTELAGNFVSLPDCEIAYVCDVDERAIDKAASVVAAKQAAAPTKVKDFRRILDDPKVDALVIAAPDHWHAPATILACAAGKHVYVEKPASHNPREGELMVEAAEKNKRVVQLGTQRRSMPAMIEAVKRLQAGELGRVLFARGWYNNARLSIGKGKKADVPSWLDYELWQGPAPEREFRDNLVHYNWHWFWHWGTGELGNNGIHTLDCCRWGLGVDYPQRVTAGGGMYYFDDDQQTPDSHVVTYDFGDKMITWEGRNWSKRGFEGSGFGMAFYGEKGSIITEGPSYKIYDAGGKQTSEGTGSGSLELHLSNFLDCVRSGARPNAPIDEGHKSTLLCHLGNIAYRTGRTLNLDPKTGQLVGDAEAAKLWSREYRGGWEPKV